MNKCKACDDDAVALELCFKHYQRKRRTGIVEDEPGGVPRARFLAWHRAGYLDKVNGKFSDREYAIATRMLELWKAGYRLEAAARIAREE